MNLSTIQETAKQNGHTITLDGETLTVKNSEGVPAAGEIVARFKREQPVLKLLDAQEERYPGIVITGEDK